MCKLFTVSSHYSIVSFSSVTQSCPTLCDPKNHSTPGFPVHHQLLEFTQTHIHLVSNAIQPSHLLSSPFPPAPNPSQHANKSPENTEAGVLIFSHSETPILWPPHVKNWLIGKDSDARRDWGQEEKGTTEDEMAGWHHWLSGHESEWTAGVGDGQGSLACCDSRGHKELDTTERLNWTEINVMLKAMTF